MARGRGRKNAVRLGGSVGNASSKQQLSKRKRTTTRIGELSPTQQSRDFNESRGGPEQVSQVSSHKEVVSDPPANFHEEQIATPPVTQPRNPGQCLHAERLDTRSKLVTNAEILRFSDEETEDDNATVGPELKKIGGPDCVDQHQNPPMAVDTAANEGVHSVDCRSEHTTDDSAGYGMYAMHNHSCSHSDEVFDSCNLTNTFSEFQQETEPESIVDADLDPCIGRRFLHKEKGRGYGLLDQQSTCPAMSSQDLVTQPTRTSDDALLKEIERQDLVQMPSDSQDCRSRGLPYEADTVHANQSSAQPAVLGNENAPRCALAGLGAILKPSSHERVQMMEITNLVQGAIEESGRVYKRKSSSKESPVVTEVHEASNSSREVDSTIPGGLHAIFGSIFGSSGTESRSTPANKFGSRGLGTLAGVVVPRSSTPFPIRHGAIGIGSSSGVIVSDSQAQENLNVSPAPPVGVLRRPTAARSTGSPQTVQWQEPNVHLRHSSSPSMLPGHSAHQLQSAFVVLPSQRVTTHLSTNDSFVELARLQGLPLPITNEEQNSSISPGCNNRPPTTRRSCNRRPTVEPASIGVSERANAPRESLQAVHGISRGSVQQVRGRREGQPSTPLAGEGICSGTMPTSPNDSEVHPTMIRPVVRSSSLPLQTDALQNPDSMTSADAVQIGSDFGAAQQASNARLNESVIPSIPSRQTRRSTRRVQAPPGRGRGRRRASERAVTEDGGVGGVDPRPTLSTGDGVATGPRPEDDENTSQRTGAVETGAVETEAIVTEEMSGPAEATSSIPIVNAADKARERLQSKLRKRAYRARKKAALAGIPPPGAAAISVNARPELSLCHGEPRDPWHEVLKKQLAVIIPLHVLCYRAMPSVTLDEYEAIYKALTSKYCNGNLLSPRWTKREVSQITQQRRTATRRKVKVVVANAALLGGNPILPAGVFQGEMDFFVHQLADEGFLKHSSQMSEKSHAMLVKRGCANPMGQTGVSARRAMHVGRSSDVPATIREVQVWKAAAYQKYLNGNSRTAVARRLMNPTPGASSTNETINEETNSGNVDLVDTQHHEVGPSTTNGPLDPDWHHPCFGPPAYHREFVLLFGREPTTAQFIEWDTSGRPSLH